MTARGPNAYDEWVAAQGIPVHNAFHVEDVGAIEVGDWAATGGRGCIVDLEGSEGLNDGQVTEIPPGTTLRPQRHLYEAITYVVAGEGSTRVWNDAGVTATFTWREGGVFSIPLNCHYQHTNTHPTASARFYSVTTAPLVMKLFHNPAFVSGAPFDFTDRFGADNCDFTGVDRPAADGRVYGNHVADVRSLPLAAWDERGAGARNVILNVGENVLCGHVSQFPVGTYKKAHRHRAGANVIILSGQGFSLLWREGEPMRRVDWRPGSVVVPPDRWFHQHFNTGPVPARYLALRWGSRRWPLFKPDLVAQSTKLGGDQIEYEDEDPTVREMFEAELARNGVASGMATAGEPVGRG